MDRAYLSRIINLEIAKAGTLVKVPAFLPNEYATSVLGVAIL